MPAPSEASRLRPMNVFQILDGAVRIYRENFALFVAISLLPTLPLHIARVASMAMATDVMATEAGAGMGEERMMTIVFISCGLAFLFLLLQHGLAEPLATGALIAAVTSRYLGRPVSIGASFAPVFRNFGRYMGTSFLVMLIHGMAAMSTCYILFCFTWVWFIFVPCVMIVEGSGGTDALNRSRLLGSGHGWRIFGASVTAFLVATTAKLLLPFAVTALLAERFDSPVLQNVVQGSLQIVIGAVVDPIWSAMAIMLYFDVRIRKEGYDLALAAHRLGPAPMAS